MNITKGNLIGTGRKITIIAARFNEFVTKALVTGALDALERHGVHEENVDIIWVPGAFEIPIIAQKIAAAGDVNAVICLGAIIRGATAHFDVVASESAKGIASVSLATGVPIINGILTTDSIEQAIERAGTKMGNKGAESALYAIEMANLLAGL